MGPKAIREASLCFTTYNSELSIDLKDTFRIVDCGDVGIVPANAQASMDAARDALLQIMAAGALPVMLGGDHSVTIAGACAMARQHPDAGLILFDMHYDTAEDVVGEKLNHCCPIRRAVEAGIDPKKTCLIGPSGWMNPKSELAFVRDMGIRSFSVEDVWRLGPKAVMAEAVAIAGAEGAPIYVTVDIDCLDSAYIPGTCVPTTFGLTPRELLPMLRGLHGANVQMLDVVEVAPNLDPSSRTAHYAVRILMEILAALSGKLDARHLA
jgi:agmatinase